MRLSSARDDWSRPTTSPSSSSTEQKSLSGAKFIHRSLTVDMPVSSWRETIHSLSSSPLALPFPLPLMGKARGEGLGEMDWAGASSFSRVESPHADATKKWPESMYVIDEGGGV